MTGYALSFHPIYFIILLQVQPSIDLALHHVPDLSENELIEALSIIVNHASSQTSTMDLHSMQIDSTPSTTPNQMPSLPDFLTTMLKYRQFTVPQLILAFRHHLRSAEAVNSVAQILDEWLKKVQSQEVKLLPSRRDITKNEHGAFVVKKDIVKSKPVHDLPTMGQVESLALSKTYRYEAHRLIRSSDSFSRCWIHHSSCSSNIHQRTRSSKVLNRTLSPKSQQYPKLISSAD